MTEIKNILAERKERYGSFKDVSMVYGQLCRIVYTKDLDTFIKYPLDAILMKIARAVCGDSSYVDNWRDIEGYAKLIADELER